MGKANPGVAPNRVADVHDRIRAFWDTDSKTYDRSPSHATSDPVEAAVWRAVLHRHLPTPGASVLDVGAGTGSLSLLAAEMGYRVTALDLSPGMLERARLKAEERGLDIETVTGPAVEPPEGPFDAVMERHMLWTAPDPSRALEAWRRVAPGGRLVLYEGIWQATTVDRRLRKAAAEAMRALLRIPHEHHSSYDEDLLSALPLAGRMSPRPLIEAVREAGWRRYRLERLRDVEWARLLAAPPVLGWLERVPHFALVAEA